MTELTEDRFIHEFENPEVVYVLKCSRAEKQQILQALKFYEEEHKAINLTEAEEYRKQVRKALSLEKRVRDKIVEIQNHIEKNKNIGSGIPPGRYIQLEELQQLLGDKT